MSGGKEGQTTPDSSRLSRNRKLDRGMWISADLDPRVYRELDSRNRCQSLRIVDPAFSYSPLLISATVSRPTITHLGLHPTEKEQREQNLHEKGGDKPLVRGKPNSEKHRPERLSSQEICEGSVSRFHRSKSLNQQPACQTVRINEREPRKTRH